VPKVLCAAPSYLEQQGKPQSPMDLKNHPALFYQLHQIVHDRWIFKKGEQQWRIKMKGQRRSNDGDLVRRWCVNGHGIALKSCLDISADLLAGRLIPLLKSYQRPTTELWLITPSREHITSTFRLLRDHLQNESQQCLKTLKQRRLI
jgi:DNA-binding transcriptional LysR family regulator